MDQRLDHGVATINLLPDNVLCHIVSLLPTKEAVRASILSRRWRYVFAAVSSTSFVVISASTKDEKAIKLMDFIDRILAFPNRPPIVRFKLGCYQCIDHKRVDNWICALKRHGIQDLELRLGNNDDSYESDDEWDYDGGIFVPPSLFSCESLVKLKLVLDWKDEALIVPARVRFPKLKVLHIVAYAIDDKSDKRLFSRCPVLEELLLLGFQDSEDASSNLNISIPTLKSLIIESFWIKKLVINAPKLEHLSYHEPMFSKKIVFKNVLSLAAVVINFKSDWPRKHFVLAMKQLLGGIQNTQSLQIDFDTLSSLESYKVPIPVFPKLTHLNFGGCAGYPDFAGMHYFLASANFLETLVIKEFPCELFTAINTNLVVTCLSTSLKNIELSGFRGLDLQVKILKYFLIKGKVLEKVTIRVPKKAEEMPKITEKLLSLPKVSEKCQLEIVQVSNYIEW